MGYDLSAANKELEPFHFGTFSFPFVIEACGYLFPCTSNAAGSNGQWEAVFGVDDRMPEGDTYPKLLSNDGFKVTAFEAKVMARCCRNFVHIKRGTIREDFLEKMWAFSDWAEASKGFRIC